VEYPGQVEKDNQQKYHNEIKNSQTQDSVTKPEKIFLALIGSRPHENHEETSK
jgi:hypothetical protein